MLGVLGSVIGWGAMLQAGRLQLRFPISLDVSNLPNPSSHTTTLGSTQPLTEISTRNLPGGKSGQHIMLRNSLPSVSWLSRKSRSLNVWQPYGPPWPVTEITLPSYRLLYFSFHVQIFSSATCSQTPLNMSTIFRDTTLCSPLKANRRFRGIFRPHLQGQQLSHARNQHKAGGKDYTALYLRTYNFS
jgi:hypothetical protein